MPPWGHDQVVAVKILYGYKETIAVFFKWQSDGYEEGVATESNSAHTQAIEDTDLPEPDT